MSIEKLHLKEPELANPTFSVLMTAYNRELFIEEAIRSVLAQTFGDWELIIVDDKSSDHTVSIAKRFESQDPRIHVYENEYNLGDYGNRNKAASYAKGNYLVYVDSDDFIYPDALDYILNCFKCIPESRFASIYQKSISAGEINRCFLLEEKELFQRHFFNESILHIGPGGTVIVRDYFNEIGGFPEIYGPANDMYYNIKAAIHSPVILMSYDYLFYRDHPGQQVKNKFAYLYQGYLYFNDMLLLQDLPLDDAQKVFLRKKNKRRFLVNLLKYFIAEWKIKKCIEAIRLAKFTIRDFSTAIVQHS